MANTATMANLLTNPATQCCRIKAAVGASAAELFTNCNAIFTARSHFLRHLPVRGG